MHGVGSPKPSAASAGSRWRHGQHGALGSQLAPGRAAQVFPLGPLHPLGAPASRTRARYSLAALTGRQLHVVLHPETVHGLRGRQAPGLTPAASSWARPGLPPGAQDPKARAACSGLNTPQAQANEAPTCQGTGKTLTLGGRAYRPDVDHVCRGPHEAPDATWGDRPESTFGDWRGPLAPTLPCPAGSSPLIEPSSTFL